MWRQGTSAMASLMGLPPFFPTLDLTPGSGWAKGVVWRWRFSRLGAPQRTERQRHRAPGATGAPFIGRELGMDNAKKFYINGEWVDPIGTETMDVINPATEEPICAIALGNSADVDRAVAAAKAAFETFSQTTRRSASPFEKIIECYKARMGDIAAAVSQEMGAPVGLANAAQAPAGLGHLMYTLNALKEFSFEQMVAGNKIVREPIGVCGLITPWNWPLNQIAAKVGPAIAAGCTMVLKPTEIAPINALIFAEVMHEAGVPAGVFNLVNGTGPMWRGHVLAPGDRHDVLHWIHPRGHLCGPGSGEDRETRHPGAWRQIPEHHPRRRRLRCRRVPRYGGHVHEHGPVL